MAGTVTPGKLGVVRTRMGATLLEAPMLTDWAITTQASVNQEVVNVMASNGDGVAASAGWEDGELQGKSWSGTLTCFYQEPITAGQTHFSAHLIGTVIDELQIFPGGVSTGKKYYSGAVFLENVNPSAAVDGKVKISVTFRGKGALLLLTQA